MRAYMIVTNDEYEFQVAHDICGKKAVAEYLGISMDCLDQEYCGDCCQRFDWSCEE